MKQDFSWDASAREYVKVYERRCWQQATGQRALTMASEKLQTLTDSNFDQP